ncbi:MAG: hypothetical protein LAO06_21130, partial [Acidobacteriia bacterium]|nr:hypothetical protein [Terriglobia bacterium]
MRRRFIGLFLLLLLGFCRVAAQPRSPATTAEIERRIDALLRRMTLEEKIGQLSQYTSATPETLKLVREGKVGSLFNVIGADNTNAAQ